MTFTHFNGMSGELYYPAIMPPGVALFDYDNDGDVDVFVVQGRMLGSKPIDRAWAPPRRGSPLDGHLFRNDLNVAADGRHTLHFTDVTESSAKNLLQLWPAEPARVPERIARHDVAGP